VTLFSGLRIINRAGIHPQEFVYNGTSGRNIRSEMEPMDKRDMRPIKVAINAFLFFQQRGRQKSVIKG
jgi:hypothetical protein